MPQQHICPNCQTPFVGRKNRVYCSHACKIEVNNNRELELRHTTKLHYTQMETNLRIIYQYMKDKPMQRVSVLKEKLIEAGFKTNGPFLLHIDDEGKTCFEVGNYLLKDMPNSYIISHKETTD